MRTPIHTILSQFESIGDNCEFGLVQRYAGIESLGLLKFAGSRLDELIHAFDTDFAFYGEADDLYIYTNDLGYMSCASRRYGFDYNTLLLDGAEDAAKVLRREIRKIGYLKRRFLEDLRSGEKILVRKGGANETSQQITDLMRAIRRHGPSKLLWVQAAEDADLAPSVRWALDGVLEGRIGRFAPYGRVTSTELPPWLDLCRQTWQLVHGLPAESEYQARNFIPPFRYLWRRHVPKSGKDLTVIGPQIDLRSLDRKAVHAFTCWIWVSDNFRGESICPRIGYRRIRCREADLSLRNTWQKIFVTATLPEEGRKLRVGLVVRGGTEGSFWSSGWRLEENTEADAAPRPPLVARILTGS